MVLRALYRSAESRSTSIARISWRAHPPWRSLLLLATLTLGAGCGPETPEDLAPPSPYRIVQPRLSVAVSYAPCPDQSPGRGFCRALGDGAEELPDPTLAAIDRRGRKDRRGRRGRSPRDPEALHRSAVERVLHAEERSELARAFTELEEALELDATNPVVLADLAALYHIHASSAEFPWHRVRALELAGRANRLAPGRPFVVFDRALFLEALALRHSATRAWHDYLALDSASPWADEARSHLADLGGETRYQRWLARRPTFERALADLDHGSLREVVIDFPLETHDLLRDELLPRWAQRVRGGQLEEAHLLATGLRALADRLAEVTGDPSMVVVVETLDPSRPELAEALELFGRGRRLYELERNWSAAEPLLARATELLAGADHPLEPWARFFAGVCRFQAGETSLEGLEGSTDEPSPLLAARIEQLLGIAIGRRQDHAAAIRHYERVLALLEPLGAETPEVAFAHFLRGEALANLGHRDRAWRELYPALGALVNAGEPRRLHAALAVTADGLMDLGLAEVALPFYDELVAHAEAWGEPYARVSACQGRAKVRRHLAHGGPTAVVDEARMETYSRGALDDLDCAAEAVEAIDDAAFRQAVLADLAVVRAELRVAPATTRLAELEEARRFYLRSEDGSRLARLSFLEARAFAEVGEESRSQEALAEALDLYDTLLHAPEMSDEPRFLPEAEEAFHAMIAWRLDRDQPGEAFALAERSRQLPGRAPAGDATTRRGAAVDDLPADLELFVFQDLDDRVVVFHGFEGLLEAAEIPIAPTDLGQRIHRLHVELLDGNAETSLTELFTLLVGEPFGEIVSDRVVIVPDRSVAGLPFAALRDPDTGTYLVERATLAVVPSLAQLHRANKQLAKPFDGAPTLLAVGEPEAESPVVRYLAPLPDARREAEAVSALYPGSLLLLGRQASRDRWLTEAPRHQLVHYAGHSSIDPFLPHRSVLHLAPSLGEANGDLSSAEIRRLAFPDTRLVVLSSCSSSLDRSTRRRVPGGLADAFLAAGVPAVIGALWPIDDGPTSKLMLELHRHLAAGEAPAEALRQVQLHALGTRGKLSDPWVWGAFRLFGGTTPGQGGS